MRIFTINLCRLQLTATPSSEHPARTAFEIATNLPFSDDLKCTCPSGTVHQDGWISKPVRSRKSASSPSADEPSLSGARKAAVSKQVNEVIIDRLALAGEGQSQVVGLVRSSSAALLGGGAPRLHHRVLCNPRRLPFSPTTPTQAIDKIMTRVKPSTRRLMTPSTKTTTTLQDKVDVDVISGATIGQEVRMKKAIIR